MVTPSGGTGNLTSGNTTAAIYFCNALGRINPVTVTYESGTLGNLTTQCAAVYNCYDINNNMVLQNASPLMQRPTLGKMVAGENGTVIDVGGGTLKLLWVDEQPSKDACPA